MSDDRPSPVPSLATREQYLTSLERYASTWGYGLSVEAFKEREDGVIRKLPFSQSMQCWVLAPSNDLDTLDFYCSLELRPVPVLVSENGAPTTSERAFVINKLYTPPHHRKQGYAKTLLEHVHKVARDPTAAGAGAAVLSYLHSDVGDFYSRFGWHIPRSSTNLDTSWDVPSLPSSSSSFSGAPLCTGPAIRALSLQDLRAVLSTDVALISAALPGQPSTTRIAIAPTFASHESSITRARFDAARLGRAAPEVWGFEAGERGEVASWAFLTFTVDFLRSTLRVLRCRSAEERGGGVAEALLRAAVEVGMECGVERVVAWSVGERVLEGLEGEWRGTTEARVLPLGAVAWYRAGHELAEGSALDWEVNEAYGSY